MKLTLQILALVISAGTLLPLIRSDIWIIRGWDFPRVQLLVAGAAVWLAQLAWGFPHSGMDFAALGILALALCHVAISMRRYLPIYPVELKAGEGDSALRVMVSNVLMKNRQSDDLVAAVRAAKPDLFLGLETDAWWTDKIAALADDLPHAVEVPQEDTYGMVLRSRFPLLDTEVKYLFRDDIPSIHARIRLTDGAELRLHAVHPKPPFPDESTDATDRDAELLLVGREVKEAGGPAIVFGDLNDVAWSRSTRLFQKTSGLLDPRIGRGFFSTYHAEHRWMRWPLDHVFISNHFRIRKIERLRYIGSDHFPILADFSYEPEKREGQETPREDPDDRKEATSKIDEARREK